MEQRVSIITLGVADLDRSRKFYEALGWTRGFKQAEGVVFFQTGGMIVSLWPRTELAKDANVPATGSGFAGITLAYNTRQKDDVAKVLVEAERAGAKILKTAQPAFWGGHYGFFADPDGFVWEVAWNPAFPLAADGSIRLPD